MKWQQTPSGIYCLALERGDSIRECVEHFADIHDIHGATVTGIGAVQDPELGYYYLSNGPLHHEYKKQEFKAVFELLSLQGNISLRGGKPFLHAHVTLGTPEFLVFGGHLFDAKVGVVVEIFLTPLGCALNREGNTDVGLAVWSCPST